MSDLLTRQGARKLTQTMDRVANTLHSHAAVLGVPADIAADFAKRSDILCDTIELKAVANFPPDGKTAEGQQVNKTPAADADPEVKGVSPESGGTTDDNPKSTDQNKPETYIGKTAAPEWAQPPKNETGGSVEPGPAADPHWDANAIADDRGGPYAAQPDEPYMGGQFAQNWFHELRDKQQAGLLPKGTFAARMAMTACFSDVLATITHTARLGTLTDTEVRDYIHQLTTMDSEIAGVQADIAKIAGALQKRADQLTADQKKLLKEFGDKLPDTLKGQGKQIVEIRDVLLQYTKVSSENPPTEATMKEGVLAEAEAKLGAAVRAAIEDIWDAVRKENVGLKKAVAKVEYSLKVSSTTPKTAGVMDWLAAVGEFFASVYKALTRLFDMATSAIDGALGRVNKAFAEYQKVHAMAMKEASSKTADDALLRRLLAEEGMGSSRRAAGDDDKEGQDEGEKTAKKSQETDEEADDEETDDEKADDEKAKTAAVGNQWGFNLFQ
jgi:hypothetical protein